MYKIVCNHKLYMPPQLPSPTLDLKREFIYFSLQTLKETKILLHVNPGYDPN